MTQRRIDSYFLRSSSRSSSTASTVTVIDVDSDALTDDEQPTAAISGSPKRRVSSSPLSALPIESYFDSAQTALRSSSLPISMRDWQLDDEDFLPLSQLLVTRSAPPPAAATRCAQPVARRALSDITNVKRVPHPNRFVYAARQYGKKVSFYKETRRRFAFPRNRKMCAYCGIREHSAIHHEDVFKRGKAVSPSLPTSASEVQPDRSHVSHSRLCVVVHCADPST